MNITIVLLRLIHVGLGVFWAGTLIFVAIFLQPAVRDAGPDGAKVMQGLMRRGFLNVMPVVAILTILSGLVLYWRVSAGLSSGWITTRYGMSLTIGGIAALIAFDIGVRVMRRSVLRAASLSQGLEELSDPAEREARQAEIGTLRERAAQSGRRVAFLLAVAVAAMAVARYL